MRYRIAAAAFAATLLGASAAQAAQATASVNVRSGPSTSYRVVDTLRPGEQVDIRECRSNGWCYVIKSGPDGWVSGRYLSGDGRPPRDRDPDIDVEFDVQFPGFSFSFGDGSPDYRPPRDRGNLVCLVTFERRSQVEAGRDADVVRARLMSEAQARRIDRPNDRHRIFDYGSNRETQRTCRYLDRLN